MNNLQNRAYRMPSNRVGQRHLYFREPGVEISVDDLADDEAVVDCLSSPDKPRAVISGARAKWEEKRG